MTSGQFTIEEEYWENLEINEADLEFLYQHLLEIETPLSPNELIAALITERVRRQQAATERERSNGGKPYVPKEHYSVGDSLSFPVLGWRAGRVVAVRPARSYLPAPFDVIQVELDGGEKREFAAGLQEHPLNQADAIDVVDRSLNLSAILGAHGEKISSRLVEQLKRSKDFVYIAGRWFPRALIVDVDIGNLNLAEAVLDVAQGGPLPTLEVMKQIQLPQGVNPKLAEFSLDLALQEDARFDEVGPAGEVLWFLHRLEPKGVLNTPLLLQYKELEYDRGVLTEEMLELEANLDDELSPGSSNGTGKADEVQISLIYPHWRAGTLPLTARIGRMFPTAYEAPRIRFMLVDGDTGEKFPGWVVRLERYVFGLRDWYFKRGLIPGSYVRVRRGQNPGEVVIKAESHRSAKEWVRTALVGADGGVVYATTKQTIETSFDDRLVVAMPAELSALDAAWEKRTKAPLSLQKVIVDMLRDLAKLNTQNHVHAAELYSAANVVMRCPPGTIMALLASRPEFVHVGDLHFRYQEPGKEE